MNIVQLATKPPVVAEALALPESISDRAYFAAIEPLFEALGIDLRAVFVHGLRVVEDEQGLRVEFLSGLPVVGVEPVELLNPMPCPYEGHDVGECGVAHDIGAWAWPVSVEIARGESIS